jgi:hypothetical protein
MRGHSSSREASQPVWPLQLLARGDPPRGDDVCALPLSLRKVDDLLFERGIDICNEIVLHCWNRFRPMFAADISRQRTNRVGDFPQWRWIGRQRPQPL